jgi:peroxiredoxin
MIAIALLPSEVAWLGSLAGFGLLMVFVAAISINMAQGRKPECHCFGQLHSAPVGWNTLARNAILACAAGVVSWGEQIHQSPSFAAIFATEAARASAPFLLSLGILWGIATAVLITQIMRQQGRILVRLEAMEGRLVGETPEIAAPGTSRKGLAIGSKAPAFQLPSVQGAELSLSLLLQQAKPILLLFTSPRCGPCTSLIPDISQWASETAGRLNVVVISEGSREENLRKIGDKLSVLLQNSREVAEAYEAHGTPAAVLIRPDGLVGSALAMGVDAVKQLASRAVQHIGNARNGSKPSLPAGALGLGKRMLSHRLQNADGKWIDIAESVSGRRVLLLFWNPTCGFCQRMLEEVRNWEVTAGPDAPNLVVVSAGTVAQNQAMQLGVPVLADPGSVVSTQVGARGTPTAVMLEFGHIASAIAVGRAEILALTTNSEMLVTAPSL